MTLCRKCGKEIPDEEELCESCKSTPVETDEFYLNQLLGGGETSQPVAEPDFFGDIADSAMPEVEPEIVPEEISFDSAFDSGLEETMDSLVAEPVQEEPAAPVDFADIDMSTFEEPFEEPVMEEPEPELEMSFEEPVEELVMEEPESEPELEMSFEEPVEEPVMEELEPELEMSFKEPVEEPVMEEPELEMSFDDPVAEPEPASEESGEEDISKLLDMLSDDYVPEEEPLEESGSEMDTEPAFQTEPDLFGDGIDSFFADATEDSSELEGTEGQMGASLDDVFNEALSAVEYSENDNSPSETMEDPFGIDAFGIEEDYSSKERPEESEGVTVKATKKPKVKKEKKPGNGFWQRLFGNIVTPETAAQEAKEREDEIAAAEEKLKLKAEQKEKEAEEKAQKAEQQKAEKDRKAAAKAEKSAAAKARKEEKKRVRLEQEANEVVGKINPVGATIVVVFFGLICLGVILGAQTFSYSRAVNKAEKEFSDGDYEDAYASISGVEVSESSEEMEVKVRICMQLKKEMNSYNNYYKMQMYLEAVDSLMKGVRSYDTNRDIAYTYNIISQYDALKDDIVDTLNSEFGISIAEARQINAINSRVDYTEKLQEIVDKWEVKMKLDEK